MRESLCELLLGMPAHRLTAAPHYGLTAALAGAAYAASLAVPSIYVSTGGSLGRRPALRCHVPSSLRACPRGEPAASCGAKGLQAGST